MAAQLGYCGLDRQRWPLQGDEIRPCWEAADATVASPTPLHGVGTAWPLESEGTYVRPLQFVEVQLNAPRAGRVDRQGRPDRLVTVTGVASEDNPEALFLTTASSGEARWSLWGDVET